MTSAKRPNILFLFTDDQRFDTISALGNKEFQRAVRDRRYKLIEYVVKGRRTTQLFDTERDLWEMVNLANEHGVAEHLRRLRLELERHCDATGDRETLWGDKFWSGYDQ